MNAHLTVFGASGRTGGHLVQQALAAGHRVTAVVRDPAAFAREAGAEETGELEVATVADVTDAAALRPVVAGRDAVLSALGPNRRKAPGIAGPATRAITEAMDATGVRRVVVCSAMPVGPLPPGESLLTRTVVYPLVSAVFRDVYGDLAVMEEALRSSALEWTAVRPGRLSDKPFTGRYRRAVGGNLPGAGGISRADLACAMLACVDDPATLKQPVGVAAKARGADA